MKIVFGGRWHPRYFYNYQYFVNSTDPMSPRKQDIMRGISNITIETDPQRLKVLELSHINNETTVYAVFFQRNKTIQRSSKELKYKK